MARETKTIQCYPDDDKINAEIKRYEAFGWELINNQRCQEYEGTHDGYRHWSTFNKLTFSRDKSSPWYNKVVALENQHDSLMVSEPIDYSHSPSKYLLILGILLGFFGIPFFVCLADSRTWFIITIAFGVLFAIGLILLSVYIAKSVCCKKEHSKYLSRKWNWKDTIEKEAEEIRRKAEAIVNGD